MCECVCVQTNRQQYKKNKKLKEEKQNKKQE